MRQADSAVAYIKQHAKGSKPFFMDVNFMKMHNPNNPAQAFSGKSHLGNYSDSMLELDANIGRIMDAIRAEAPDTIVIITADNGAWQDAWPDAGTTPFRGEKGSAVRGRLARARHHVVRPARSRPAHVLRRDDVAYRRLGDAGHDGRPHAAARTSWVGQRRQADLFRQHRQQRLRHWASPSIRRATRGSISTARPSAACAPTSATIPRTPSCNIAWKYLYTAKDTWLGPEQNLGAIGSLYNLTMDPFEKYDMTFNGAVSHAAADHLAGPLRRPGQRLGSSLVYPVLIDFDKSIMKFPNIKRFPGGASNDLVPNLQDPANPVPAMDPKKPPKVKAGGG